MWAASAALVTVMVLFLMSVSSNIRPDPLQETLRTPVTDVFTSKDLDDPLLSDEEPIIPVASHPAPPPPKGPDPAEAKRQRLQEGLTKVRMGTVRDKLRGSWLRAIHAQPMPRRTRFIRATEVFSCVPPLLCQARAEVEAAATALASQYGDESKELFASLHFVDRDFIRRKLAHVALAAAEGGDEGKQPEFVVSFSGTSVTAGHDNNFDQSFPIVFYKALNDSFNAAGVRLVVRNHAMGNNPPIPSALCVGSQLGSDMVSVPRFPCFSLAWRSLEVRRGPWGGSRWSSVLTCRSSWDKQRH
jgi:hypothetical protein